MRPSRFDDEFWMNRGFERGRATEEEIRENQRLNRLQREREERACQNDNSTSSNGQDAQDNDKG
jgi:hypothetical protein